MAEVSLREVTADNRNAILALELTEVQLRFIADNLKTLKQADRFPAETWLRSIYADERPVGLALLQHKNLPDEPPSLPGFFFLWRLMVDFRQQRKGYGRRAIDLIVEHVSKCAEATRLLSSYKPGSDGPEGFYKRCGFTPTGATIGADVEIELPVKRINQGGSSLE